MADPNPISFLIAEQTPSLALLQSIPIPIPSPDSLGVNKTPVSNPFSKQQFVDGLSFFMNTQSPSRDLYWHSCYLGEEESQSSFKYNDDRHIYPHTGRIGADQIGVERNRRRRYAKKVQHIFLPHTRATLCVFLLCKHDSGAPIKEDLTARDRAI